MLYIFDLGNVIVDIDFNRVLGAWSDFSRVPLATLKQNFAMGETFHLHERGEISDEAFAERFCQEMGLSLSYEQFSHGWQAIFVAIRPGSDRHHAQAARAGASCRRRCRIPTACIPPSGRMNTRKSTRRQIRCISPRRWGCVNLRRASIRRYCRKKDSRRRMRSFFDDNADNIEEANQLGITSILVTGKETIPNYFAKQLC